MAEAWVARLQGRFGFEKLVAIKTILPKFASDPRFQRMFLDEARIASGIEHTNVAHTLDLGEERGVLYIVMEWIDGDALSKLHRAVDRKGQPLPIGILLRIVADACGGLHAAHELRGADGSPLHVVHRDVSPQNILVSARGEAKLIDFGVAKARDRVAGDTNAGMLKGRIVYMAPEQALGREVDRRADLWAVGALLYHLLSGRPPYEGENPLATLHLLTSGEPPPPLPAHVPAPVARLVERALSHSPDGRPADADEMQAAIERAMVEANARATVADVAQFCALHLEDRASQRKRAIELALSAASERMRVAPRVKLARDDSMLDVPSIPGAAGRPIPIDVDDILPTEAAAQGLTEASAVQERPSRWTTGDPPPPRPSVSGARRGVALGTGVLVCLGGATLLAWRGTLPRAETTPRGASFLPATPVTTDAPRDEFSGPPLPDSFATLEAAGDAADAGMAGETTASRAQHLPVPSFATVSPRASSASKPAPTVTSIPEVIDNGF